MNLLKLTIAGGPDKGNLIYVNKDKICGFYSIICRLAENYGKEKGSYILLDNGFGYEVQETVEDICKMLESSNGYLQITSMPKKD